MAKAKSKPKPKVPFGGYSINFKGRTETLESLFGSAPIPPSEMTKRLWEFVKRHHLATKG
jgi:chromatin remodeling complex protein RSC6